MTERCTPAQVRRAAGSSSLEKLKSALIGWTAEELAFEGKTALHLAAWKGSIDNVKYLIEEVCCDINQISTDKFSYGKTALFFAATQSRADVLEYLIDQGACSKIINNKGQSVLSIASSHDMPSSLLEKIQHSERVSPEPWRNYRATHSDELEYGDLDPRFLDRPLRPTDIVTPLAVNPTTKQTRPGGFLRRNPHLAEQTQNRKSRKKPRKKKERRPSLTVEEHQEVEQAWNDLRDDPPTAVRTIVRLSDKRRRAWITKTADRIRNMDGLDLNELNTSEEDDDRLQYLLERLQQQIRNPTVAVTRSRCCKMSTTLVYPDLTNGYWRVAVQATEGLDMHVLARPGAPSLRLPEPPTWVDTCDTLEDMGNQLQRAGVIGVDTEWYTDEHGDAHVATLQLATNRPDGEVRAWVVELLGENTEYLAVCRQLMQDLFTTKILLGFAVSHDIPKVEEWLGQDIRLPREKVLDIQSLWKAQQLPGLARCALEFSSVALSKDEQCSEWSGRPLRQSQLDYAGLDAAVLLFLMAEKYRTQSMEDG